MPLGRSSPVAALADSFFCARGGPRLLEREDEELFKQDQLEVEDLLVRHLRVLGLLHAVRAFEEHRHPAADVVERTSEVEGGRGIGRAVRSRLGRLPRR
jgi:hypothetical protein